jgi:hypothetical protein
MPLLLKSVRVKNKTLASYVTLSCSTASLSFAFFALDDITTDPPVRFL